MCLVNVACCQVKVLRRADPSSKEVLPSVCVSLGAIRCNNNCVHLQRMGRRVQTKTERNKRTDKRDRVKLCRILCFVDLRPCTISQINPTRSTLLFNIFVYLFISLLYVFRASMRLSSGENYCIYATLALVTLYGWRLVGWLE